MRPGQAHLHQMRQETVDVSISRACTLAATVKCLAKISFVSVQSELSAVATE